MRIFFVAGLSIVLSSATLAQEPAANGPDARKGVAETAPVYQPTSQLDFVALSTGCRIFNVRVTATTPKALRVAGTAGFSAQGGKDGGCGIPETAVAVVITLSTKSAQDSGTAIIWPRGSKPAIITTSFPKTAQVSTGTTLSLSDGRFKLFSTKTATFIGDVTGYYVLPMATMISPSGSPYSGASSVLAATRITTGIYEVQFDRTI
jgi:hypothetical protein